MLSKKSNSLSSIFFQIGFFLIIVIAITLLLSSATFFLGGTMGRWQFPLGILIALILNYILYIRNNHEETSTGLYLGFGISLILVLLSIAVSNYFYDTSFDGQAYHMETLIQMKNGWNPYWEYLPNSVNQAIWVNHYAKGIETVQAAIYCTFDHIESGKATNIMLWLGSFFVTLSFIFGSEWVSLKKAVVISALLACNPIVLNQLLTHYVDGALASLLLCLLVSGMFILKKPETKYFLLLSATIILLVNVKFTALLFLGLFIGGFLIWLMCNKQAAVCKKIWWTSVAAGIIAILAGFNPYITNTVHFDHPLYPLMGKNKVDIIYALNLPAGFENKSGLERFFISTFARTDNIYPRSPYKIEIKLPFTFNKTDLINAPMVDARLGGFGPMYSGILLLSIGLLFLLYRNVREQLFFRNLMWLSLVIIISIILMPESWWARYIPQFWFLPVIWLLAAEVLLIHRYRVLKHILYIVLVINLLFCVTGFLFNLLLTTKINYQLALLKSSSQTVRVDWGTSASNRIRFSQNHIPYKVENLQGPGGVGADKEYMAGSQTWFILPADADRHIKEPWVLKAAGGWPPFVWRFFGR